MNRRKMLTIKNEIIDFIVRTSIKNKLHEKEIVNILTQISHEWVLGYLRDESKEDET